MDGAREAAYRVDRDRLRHGPGYGTGRKRAFDAGWEAGVAWARAQSPWLTDLLTFAVDCSVPDGEMRLVDRETGRIFGTITNVGVRGAGDDPAPR